MEVPLGGEHLLTELEKHPAAVLNVNHLLSRSLAQVSLSSRRLHLLISSSSLSNLSFLSPFPPFLFPCVFFLSCFSFVLLLQGHDDAAPCAVLKSVDSFSFLQHPVHQRSLEILQRCKEDKYSKAATTTITPPYFHVRPWLGETVGTRLTNIINSTALYCSQSQAKRDQNNKDIQT